MTKQDIAASTEDANKKRDNKTWQINKKKHYLHMAAKSLLTNYDIRTERTHD